MTTRTKLVLAVTIAVAVISGVVAVTYDAEPPDQGPGSARTFSPAISQRVIDDQPNDAAKVPGAGSPPLIEAGPGSSAIADSDQPFVQGRVIVRFRSDASEAARGGVRRDLGARLLRELPIPGAELLALPAGVSVEEARRRIGGDPAVAYAEPDHIYTAGVIAPNDPRFSSLWGLQNPGNTDVDAPESWQVTTGADQVEVAIVDTGVAYDHPDLAPNIWSNPAESGGGKEINGVDDDGNGYVDDFRGWDWVARDNDPLDLHGHGTHVAGTVGAVGDNGLGVTGVSWNVDLVPLRVLDADGSGTTSSITSAFSYAGAMGIDVVNASLGGPSSSRSLADAIERWPGTLFVVAAGNESTNNDQVPSYPCNYASSNIVCVGSMTQGDQLSSFSNYGATNVDLGAPGSGILSTVPSQTVPFRDSFETGFSDRWSAQPTWGLATDNYGSYLADNPDGPYTAGVNASVQMRNGADLRGGAGCRLRSALRLDVEANDDRLVAEGSADGTTWTGLGSWTGSSGGRWSEVSADLSRFDGRSGVLIRFRLVADGDGIVGQGADLDDVQVACVGTSYSGSELATFSGTSMATPHVAGAAAILEAASPGLDAARVKSALLKGAVAIPALAGKTVTGGRLNLFRSLQQVAAVPIEPEPRVVATPTPAPSFTQSEQLPPSPAPSRTPATTSPTPVPEEPAPQAPAPASPASPAPAPASPAPASPAPASPAPTPSPSPSGDEPAPVRSLGLTLRRHVVATGVVTADSEACRSGISVILKRNGARVATARTDVAGNFKIRLKDRPGRYVVVAAATSACPRAKATARHSHVTSSAQAEPDVDSVGAAASSSCWTFRPSESQFAQLTNAARAEAASPSLKLDPELSKVARRHTRDMVATQSLSHSPSDQLGSRVVGWSRLGENIAVGQGVDALQQAFMNSTAHRDNILSRGFTHVGVGAIERDGRLWVTVIFSGSTDPATTLRMPRC